jgi:phenylalanyl-tRNA synthetase beta chain
LLQNALTNFHHQVKGVNLFEMGRIFDQGPDGVHETRRLGLLSAGDFLPPHWRRKASKTDFYELLGLLESFFNALGIAPVEKAPCSVAAFHPKRSATLTSGGTVLGWIGDIHPDLQAALDTSEPLVAAELDILGLMHALPKTGTFVPPVHRDLSMVVQEALPYDKIDRTIQDSAGDALESVALIDLYRGKAIGEQMKSLTVSLMFRHRERTLKDSEVESAMEKTKKELEKQCNAKIRQ